jgi:hypothetical protein
MAELSGRASTDLATEALRGALLWQANWTLGFIDRADMLLDVVAVAHAV